MGQRVGYRRVSSWEQRSDRQLEGLALDELFEDRASGKDLKRPAWEEAERYLRRGDVLFVHSMDRLARNLADLLAVVEGLNRKGVEVRFVRENLCFEAGVGGHPLVALDAVAAGGGGRVRAVADPGTPASPGPDQVVRVRERLAEGARVSEVARELGVSRQTVYASLRPE